MAISTQVKRLGRLRSKIRTDLWPDPPQIPETMTKRFPDLEKFNRQMRLWSQQIRNATEHDEEQP